MPFGLDVKSLVVGVVLALAVQFILAKKKVRG